MNIITRYQRDGQVRPKSDFTVRKDDKKQVINKDVVSRTMQSERDATDINKIVAKAKRTGVLGSGLPGARKAMYGDFTGAGDYQEQMRKVAAFRHMFESLPSDVRNKFKNDPGQLLEFVNNPENKEEAMQLGLLPRPVIERKKVTAQDGKSFNVTYKDGVEIGRVPVLESDPGQAPEAAPPPIIPGPEAS